MTDGIIDFTKHARRRNVTLKHENLVSQPILNNTTEGSLLDSITFEHDEDTIKVTEDWDEDIIEITIIDTKSGEAYDGYRLPPYVFSIIGTAYMNMMDGYTDTDDETQ